MGATYTRQSTYSDGDVITAAHTNDEFNQLLAAFQASSGHTHDGTANEGGPITKMLGTSLTLGDGTAGTDITVTFDGETNDGVLKWMEDEDYFEFSDDILIASTEKIQFGDTATFLQQSSDGVLRIDGEATIDLNASTAVTVSNDLKLDSDSAVLGFGADNDVTLTHVADTALLLNSSRQLQFGDSGTYIHQSADGVLDLVSDTEIEINATTIDINGAVDVSGNITVGGNIIIGSADISEAELEVLDGLTVTTAEVNILDGDTSATSTTVADADRVVMNDNGTMVQVAVTDLAAYFDDEITAMPNLVTTAATTVGALNSGSITSGFGTIDTGSSTITTTGLITGGSLDIDDVVINGTTIGHTDDTDLITLADGVVTIAGDLTISGDDLTMGTNTSGHIMVADGTNFNPVAVSGDVTIASNGAVTIANGAVETAMVNANVITGQTAETSLDTSNDTILIHDADAGSLKKTTLASISSALGGITDVVADTSPQLGGNLDTNSHNILIDDAHFIADENGNEQIIFQTTASAVNQFDVTNAATGNAPSISATGGDTNVSMRLLPKGSGTVIVDGDGSTGGVIVSDGNIDIRSGSGSVGQVKFYCEVNNAHAQTLKAQPHSAGSSAVLTLPTATGTLVGTGDTGSVSNDMLAGSIGDSKLSTISTAGKVALSALEIDGGTDIGADLADADLLIVDDGAGGTNRKTAMSRVATYIEGGISGDITISSGTAAIGSGVIVNADVNSSAALEFSKMENLTASRALVSDSNGDVSAATTTSTEIGYVNGVTSAIQTQLDAKASKGFATAMAIAL
jgi:hypothetical protein